MLAAPASQKLYPYHDSPSLLCIYAAYGSPGSRRITNTRTGRAVLPVSARYRGALWMAWKTNATASR
jgi:hypothetical protein